MAIGTGMDAVNNTTPSFTKKFSAEHGQFYYIKNDTGEATWDKPHGIDVPLEPSSGDCQTCNIQEQQLLESIRQERRLRCVETLKMIRDDFQKEKQKLQWEANENEARRRDFLWNVACKQGVATGKVSICWKQLGCIPDQLYTFRETHGRDLEFLRLDGNDLKDMEEIPYYCQTVRYLSLASNRIEAIPDDIALMSNLVHLNLIRNVIEVLPSGIGNLVNLEVLECANNHLVELPPSIGNLRKLERLNLECNNLRRLPDELILMRLVVLNCNFNELTELPSGLHMIRCLRVISACGNHLTCIPEKIEDSKSLEVLHLSNNAISDLPPSLGRLKSLKSLWVDFNKLKSLPKIFHEFENLVDLRVEGNECEALTATSIVRPAAKKTSSDKLAMARMQHESEMESIEAAVKDAVVNAQQFLDSVEGRDVIHAVAKHLWGMISASKSAAGIRDGKSDSAQRLTRTALDFIDERHAVWLHDTKPATEKVLIQALAKIQQNLPSLAAALNERAKKDRITMTFRRNNVMVGYVEDEIKKIYVSLAGETRRKHAMEIHNKIKVVLRSWVGPSVKDVFHSWRCISKDRQKRLKWENYKALQESRLKYEQECAFLEYSKDQAHEWVQRWDEFNDLPYWVHTKTNEVAYEEPSFDKFLPPGWAPPIPPQWMLSEESGELLSPRSLCRQEKAAFATTLDSDKQYDMNWNTKLADSARNLSNFCGIDAELESAVHRILERKRCQFQG